MGKYMRKAKMTGEVAVMETLGVRTRARALALQKPASNAAVAASASYLQLRSRRLLKPVVQVEARKTKEAVCREKPSPITRLVSNSVNSGSVGSVSVSPSKKNSVADAIKEPILGVSSEGSPEDDAVLEPSFGENVLVTEGRDRSVRETTPSSLIRTSETLGTPGSTTRPMNSSVTQPRIHSAMCRNIPTTHEMEEFFASAEQQQQRLFAEKYNYDPVNDSPLPGRFEWERLDE